jgi:hypothetical protein
MTDTKSIRIALSLLFLAAVPHAVAQQQQQGEFVMAPLLEEQKPEPLDPDEIMAASESLEVIRKLVRREKYLEASEALKPLLGKPYFPAGDTRADVRDQLQPPEGGPETAPGRDSERGDEPGY